MKLNQWTTIIDLNKFFDAHKRFIQRNKNNKTYLPYLERMEEVKKLLNESSDWKGFEKHLGE